MAVVGPSVGNGFTWTRGPYTVGVWNEPDMSGFGEPMVIGHLSLAGWIIDGTIYQDTPDGWQNTIDVRENGLIGSYYAEYIMPKVNDLLPIMYPLNPYIGVPIANTDKYSKDVWNALLSQYTGVDANGNLIQVPYHEP